VEVQVDHADRVLRPAPRRLSSGPALAGHERTVLTNQQIQMLALLVGEFEEDALAFGFLEPFAVAFEEAVRPALARMPISSASTIVDALLQFLGAAAKSRWRRLEEQERRLRFQAGLSPEVPIARFEFAEVIAFSDGEPIEDLAPARVARHSSPPGIELLPLRSVATAIRSASRANTASVGADAGDTACRCCTLHRCHRSAARSGARQNAAQPPLLDERLDVELRNSKD
jgi:hypothetical protein